MYNPPPLSLQMTPQVHPQAAVGGHYRHVFYEMEAITPVEYSELQGSLEGVRNLCIETQLGSLD